MVSVSLPVNPQLPQSQEPPTSSPSFFSRIRQFSKSDIQQQSSRFTHRISQSMRTARTNFFSLLTCCIHDDDQSDLSKVDDSNSESSSNTTIQSLSNTSSIDSDLNKLDSPQHCTYQIPAKIGDTFIVVPLTIHQNTKSDLTRDFNKDSLSFATIPYGCPPEHLQEYRNVLNSVLPPQKRAHDKIENQIRWICDFVEANNIPLNSPTIASISKGLDTFQQRFLMNDTDHTLMQHSYLENIINNSVQFEGKKIELSEAYRGNGPRYFDISIAPNGKELVFSEQQFTPVYVQSHDNPDCVWHYADLCATAKVYINFQTQQVTGETLEIKEIMKSSIQIKSETYIPPTGEDFKNSPSEQPFYYDRQAPTE
ncbi:MAG: hypothetical protein V4629_08955 [Pseudomonadota bacterium]